MLMPMDVDLIKWLDYKAQPWKPKDDAPEDIKIRLNKKLEEMREKENMINGK